MRELFALNREIVRNVARTYENCKNVSKVAAVAWEPSQRSPKWSPAIAHYGIDVENTIRKAFDGREDKKELHAAWKKFLESDETIIDKGTARMIRILASAFRRCGIEPRAYFRASRFYNQKSERAA